VSWTTSKPADALVQYGESVLLGRTAYNGQLVTNHAVTVSGLLANHNYYYQVVSRDDAGNTTVDDNHGAFYTFTTRKAPRPPWFDNLEDGARDWTVVPDTAQGTDLNWSLGTPNNALAPSAHSGTNAWASNLNGQSFNLFESSFLYSPVIDLSGFSSATLTFWHCCDFSSMFESGQIGISTNSSTPPASLPTVVDYSGLTTSGWEQADPVDLTPFVGKTIQVVWYYQGIDVGSTPSGWLVDDISITGVSGGGTILISKNLGQAKFTLNGPISASGAAPSTTITNAPPGPYTVHFYDVDFYRTPPDQSQTLTNGGSVAFTGTYDYIDANQNGISDAWEKYYFGSVTTNRTQYTDTDGDGMSDYVEFIAGTDPTNAASKLVFLSTERKTNGLVRLQWSAVPGRLYQVLSTPTPTNLASWSPVSDWLQASGSPMSCTTTNAGQGTRFYRIQVRP
jgi:hypothetical protein